MIKPHDSLVVKVIVPFLTPFIQIFGLYVLMFGHYSPGGGFQAGVLLGAAVILNLLDGYKKELKYLSVKKELCLASLGVLIYALAGILPHLWGGLFLDYASLPFPGIHDAAERRYYGILWIEIGVTLAVSMTLVAIFHVLAIDDKAGPE